jgi:TPR repeat protein
MGRNWPNRNSVRQDEQNEKEAAKWFNLAANQGHPGAQYYLGLCIIKESPMLKHRAKLAFQWFKKAARQGIAQAQYLVGLQNEHFENLVRRQNPESAVRWYSKASEQGHMEATYSLGFLYLHGRGVATNNVLAAKLFHTAAAQGHEQAQLFLGFMFSEGRGVPQNFVEAAKWYAKASEQGQKEASYCLGHMFERGIGVAQSYAGAAQWYAKAHGHKQALFCLGCLYMHGVGVVQNAVKAAELFESAARRGHARAMVLLGTIFGPEKGRVVVINATESACWLGKAAAEGYPGTPSIHNSQVRCVRESDLFMKWWERERAKDHWFGQKLLREFKETNSLFPYLN